MQACIRNIGPRQRRRRLAFGAVSLAAAIALGAAVLALASPPVLARAAIFVPLYAAFLGFLQYREGT